MFEFSFLGFHLSAFRFVLSKLPRMTRLPSESRELVAFLCPWQFFFVSAVNEERLKMYFIHALRICSFYLREEEDKQ
jgi:hypothetical protein